MAALSIYEQGGTKRKSQLHGVCFSWLLRHELWKRLEDHHSTTQIITSEPETQPSLPGEGSILGEVSYF